MNQKDIDNIRKAFHDYQNDIENLRKAARTYLDNTDNIRKMLLAHQDNIRLGMIPSHEEMAKARKAFEPLQIDIDAGAKH